MGPMLGQVAGVWRHIAVYVSMVPGGDESIQYDPILDLRSISRIQVRIW